MEKRPMRVLPVELEANAFGRALLTGRLIATVESKRSGTPVSLQLLCKREKTEEDVDAGRFKWLACGFAEAARVYIDVPTWTSDGAVVPSKEVGVWNVAGRFANEIVSPYSSDGFDLSRIWSAIKVIEVAADRAVVEGVDYKVLLGTHCLVCGAELTDKDSIERGIGPTCWAKVEGYEPSKTTRQARPTGAVNAEVDRAHEEAARRGPPDDRQMTMIPGEQFAGSAALGDFEHPWWERDEARRNRGIDTQRPRAHRDDYMKRIDEGKGPDDDREV